MPFLTNPIHRRLLFLALPLIGAGLLLLQIRGALAAVTAVPNPPVITEPGFDGKIVSASDVHMETGPISDPDGNDHLCTDWEIVLLAGPEVVWQAPCATGAAKVHIHLGDGAFVGRYAGRSDLEFDRDYRLRARHIDTANEIGGWAQRDFRTGPASQVFPMLLDDVLASPAPTWKNGAGVPVILPPGSPPPFLRLASPAGQTILQIAGFDGVTNTITNPLPLPAHEPARIELAAGGLAGGLVLTRTSLAFFDDEGKKRAIDLPAVSIPAGQSRFFWVSTGGSTYTGTSGQGSPNFSQLARGAAIPWTVLPAGYQVEVAAGGFQLPVNIAFAPEGLYGGGSDDPLYYVTELYGKIKVATRGGSVFTYASGLLNFNPTGNFPGSGEQGVTGITVDPATGDVFASMLYSSNPADENAPHYPKVVRFQSVDGGRTALTQTTILDMVGETQAASHQISKLTIGPDGKLYVHMGDGFNVWTALDLTSLRGKILRVNLNGSPPPDNPLYTGAGGARDYIYAYGFRNPFGGSWRAADSRLYIAENGPAVDRLARVISGTSYGWNGTDASMRVNALYNWDPAHAPVDIAFIQGATFGGSGYPTERQDRAFVTESGPTWATGSQTLGKRIVEFTFDGSGALADQPANFLEYSGAGKGTAAGLAAGPDGLYFTDLYKDLDFVTPIDAGARVFRIRFVGVAKMAAAPLAGVAPLSVGFTDQSTVPNPTGWLWDFGDGTTSTQRNPVHVYSQAGVYEVRLQVASADGVQIQRREGLISVRDPASGGLFGQYFTFTGTTPPAAPFQSPLFSRLDSTVDFDWGAGAPDPGSPADRFAVRWTGQLVPRYTEGYTITAGASDGIRVYLDGQLIVDDWSNHPYQEKSGVVSLTANRRYDLEVHYYQDTGDAAARLLWESARQPRQVIPLEALFPPADLGLTQSLSAHPARTGGVVTATFAVSNSGPYTATGVVLTITLPTGASFLGGTGCAAAGGVVTCQPGSLAPGQVKGVPVRLRLPLKEAAVLVSQGAVSAATFDYRPVNNSSTFSTTVTVNALPLLFGGGAPDEARGSPTR